MAFPVSIKLLSDNRKKDNSEPTANKIITVISPLAVLTVMLSYHFQFGNFVVYPAKETNQFGFLKHVEFTRGYILQLEY